MPDNNNIELRLNVNTKDAEQAINEFSKASDRAFSSSDRKVQQMGVSLDRTVGKMKSVKSEMDKMINTKVPTDEYKNLETRIKSLQKEVKTYQKEADRAFKHKVETAEYAQLQTIFNDLQTKAKALEATLKKDYSGKSAFTQEFLAVSKQVDSLQNKLAKLKANQYIFQASGATSGEEYKNLTKDIKVMEQSLQDAQKARLRLMMGGRHMVDPQGYRAVTRELTETTRQMNIADQQLRQLEADGQRWDLTSYTEANNKVQMLTAELENAQKAQQMLQQGGITSQTMAQADPERFNMLQDTMTNLARQGQMFADSIYRGGANISDVRNKTNGASSAVEKLKQLWAKIKPETGRAKDGVKDFGRQHEMSFKKMLTQTLKYVFGIRSIFLAYKKLRTELKNGMISLGKDFTEIQEQINALGNSWWAFKSSLTSAFQPIFSYVIPALVTLIDYLTSAMNALANFFALLTGQGYYYKAVKGNKDFAKSVGGTGDAAKDASEDLAEYDKLLVIDSGKGGSGGGGGGGMSDEDAYNWEKVDTTANSLVDKVKEMWAIVKQAWKDSTIMQEATTALDNIKSLIETIGQTFYDVFTAGYGYDWLLSLFNLLGSIFGIVGDIAKEFKKAWEEGDTGKKLVESIFTTLTNVNVMLTTIAESFRTAWNDGTGKAICQDILQIITNINNTIGNLASQFTKAWEKAGIGDGIMKGILTIVEDISSFINDITEATAEWAAELDFEPILKSIKSLIESIHTLLQPILTIAKAIYTDVVLPLVKKLFEKNIPSMITEISTAISSAGNALKELEPYLEKILPYVEKIAESGIDAVFSVIGQVISAISGELKLLRDFLDWLSSVWDKTLKPIIEGIKEALGPFKAIVEPISEFIKLILQLLGIQNPFKNLSKEMEESFKDLVIPESVQKIIDFFDWFNKLSDDGQGNISKTLNLFGNEDDSFKNAKKDYDNMKDKDAKVTGKGEDGSGGVLQKLSDWWKTIIDKDATLAGNGTDSSGGVLDKLKEVWQVVKSGKTDATLNAKGKKDKTVDKIYKIWNKVTKPKGNNTKAKLTASATMKDKGTFDAISRFWSLGNTKIAITATAVFNDQFSSALNAFVNKVNAAVKAYKMTKGAVGGIVTPRSILAGFAGGGVITQHMRQVWDSIPKYASGTTNAHGTLFLAGEAGPEILGHVGGRTEVLNKSQIATAIYNAVVSGIKSALATIPSFNMSVDLSTLQNLPPIPVVVTGQLLPLTEAFMFKFDEQHKDFEDIKSQLDEIITRLSTVESSNHEPIMLQLDGKTIVQLVWDATQKRYKQTGKPMFA